ncbi:MAG: zinc-binding dehydrogenase [Crocinitomicaceae bacterium]|nr:zinc-binding dehydrogenase [Crocinitomicaceae bacterium]
MACKGYYLVKNGSAKSAFELRDVVFPSIAADQLEIKVTAFGLNYADVMARAGLYKECPPLPTILGYEVVGEVIAQGNDVQENWIGKRVVAFTRFGGYAQKVRTNYKAAVEIGEYPAGQALCLATQYVTAYYMAKVLLNIRPDDRVLVHAAAGGVGVALIDILQMANVKIIAKVGGRAKKSFLQNRGVKDIVNYKEEDYQLAVKRMLGKDKLDISFNPFGGGTFKKDFALMGAGGRLVLFGASEMSGKKWGLISMLNFARKMGLLIPISLVMSSKSLLGVNMLKIADQKPDTLQFCLNEVVALAKAGKVQPYVGQEFFHEQLADAHETLASGNSIGKIAVFW